MVVVVYVQVLLKFFLVILVDNVVKVAQVIVVLVAQIEHVVLIGHVVKVIHFIIDFVHGVHLVMVNFARHQRVIVVVIILVSFIKVLVQIIVKVILLQFVMLVSPLLDCHVYFIKPLMVLMFFMVLIIIIILDETKNILMEIILMTWVTMVVINVITIILN